MQDNHAHEKAKTLGDDTCKIWPEAKRPVLDRHYLERLRDEGDARGRCIVRLSKMPSPRREEFREFLARSEKRGDLRLLEAHEVGGATNPKLVAEIRAGRAVPLQLRYMEYFDPWLKDWTEASGHQIGEAQ